VTLELQTIPNATVVPQQALQIGQDGAFVFALTDRSTVEQRAVTAGQRVGDDIVIEKGIQPGDRVVTEGQLRLEDGTRVQIADANGTPAGGREGRSGRGGRGGRGGRRSGDGGAAGSGAQ
jgi:multidrug efflux system membrane fusion protein